MILDGMGIEYEAIDITLPGKENEREFMRNHSKQSEGHSVPLPPQIFYNDEYIGDYFDFDNAVEDNSLVQFLKLEPNDDAVASPTQSYA